MLSFIGDLVESVSDAIGLPEFVGDIFGGAADFFTGNYAGVFEHGLDLFENFEELIDNDDRDSSRGLDRNPEANDTDAWRRLMKEDPEAFSEAMKELDPNVAQTVTMNLQQAVQAENRTWSMMTNIQNAEHQTSKAIIGNFRV